MKFVEKVRIMHNACMFVSFVGRYTDITRELTGVH